LALSDHALITVDLRGCGLRLHHHGRANRLLHLRTIATGRQYTDQTQRSDQGENVAGHVHHLWKVRGWLQKACIDASGIALWNICTGGYSKNSKLTSPVLKIANA